MPICNPGKRDTCGFFSSPRQQAVDDAADAVSRPAQHRACDILDKSRSSPTPGMSDRVMDELVSKITMLGERVMSIESTLAQKARGDEVKQENTHGTLVSSAVYIDTGRKGNVLTSVEGLPEVLNAATDTKQQEHIEAHATLHELLHSLDEGLRRAIKESTDTVLQENAQAHFRLQESLQRLEKRIESAIDQHEEHAAELKDEMRKVNRANAQPGPQAVRHDPEAPAAVSTVDHADEVLLVRKELPRDRSSRQIRMSDAAEIHEEDAAETLEHMTAKKRTRNDDVAKRRKDLESKKDCWQEWRSPPENHLAKFVRSDVFGGICSCIIVINTCVLAIETNEAVTRASEGDFSKPLWSRIANIVFVVWFCLELGIRVIALRCAFFIGAGWYWNLFDSLMVLPAFTELVQSSGKHNYTFFRVVKVFRMFRALRILRVFRYVRDLRLMVVSIAGSFLSLFWAFVLLFILISCCAVLLCEQVAWYMEDEWESGRSIDGELENFYGSVSMAMYTLVLAISGGEDWIDLVTPLYKVGPFLVFVFIVYTLFVQFGMLNVLTGIFVDRATEVTTMDRDIVIASERLKVETFAHSLVAVFKDMDVYHAGFITWPEFQTYCDREDVKA